MVNKSEQIDQLAAALALAQAQLKGAAVNSTNPFLKSRYADIGAFIEAARQAVPQQGLAVTQIISGDGATVTVTTLLMHKSGQWIESVISLPVQEEKGKSMAQVAGSIATYLRRYAYAGILGMYSDDDLDGDAASTRTRRTETEVGRGAPPAAPPAHVDPKTGEVIANAATTNGNATPASPAKLLALVNAHADVRGYYQDEANPGAVLSKLGTAIGKQLGIPNWKWPAPSDGAGWRKAVDAAIQYARDQHALEESKA